MGTIFHTGDFRFSKKMFKLKSMRGIIGKVD
jgi:hypothetical protein